MNLKSFLNPIQEINYKFVVSERFLDDDGKPIEWTLKPITDKEDAELRKACTRKIPVAGKKGVYMPELDTNTYFTKLIAACVTEPNLNLKELQDGYHVMSAEDLLGAMLLAGERSELQSKVLEINGFKSDFELLDEAKNS